MSNKYYITSNGSFRELHDDELAHAVTNGFGKKKTNHKYIDRKWSKGKWVYTYPDEKKTSGKSISNIAKTNATSSKMTVNNTAKKASSEYEAELAYNSKKNVYPGSKTTSTTGTSSGEKSANNTSTTKKASSEYEAELAYNSKKNVHPDTKTWDNSTKTSSTAKKTSLVDRVKDMLGFDEQEAYETAKNNLDTAVKELSKREEQLATYKKEYDSASSNYDKKAEELATAKQERRKAEMMYARSGAASNDARERIQDDLKRTEQNLKTTTTRRDSALDNLQKVGLKYRTAEIDLEIWQNKSTPIAELQKRASDAESAYKNTVLYKVSNRFEEMKNDVTDAVDRGKTKIASLLEDWSDDLRGDSRSTKAEYSKVTSATNTTSPSHSNVNTTKPKISGDSLENVGKTLVNDKRASNSDVSKGVRAAAKVISAENKVSEIERKLAEKKESDKKSGKNPLLIDSERERLEKELADAVTELTIARYERDRLLDETK